MNEYPSLSGDPFTELCLSDLHCFVKYAWQIIDSNPFIDNWHIGAMAEHLQAVTQGQIKRLLINIPPGCSKSLMVSVFWPMWEWARDPSVRFYFASYDQRLSTRDSVKRRELMSSQWYQKRWGSKFVLTHDENQKTYYKTDRGGYCMASSVGGHITGEHPHRIVVDDAHNMREAESEVERQSVIDWWDLALSTRGIALDVRKVIVMQRLHHQDLAAHVLEEGDWEHLCLPMRYEHGRMKTTCLGFNDPRKEEGELLTPKQFPEEVVKRVEKVLGPYGTSGQLQQRPAPKGGGMFKIDWFSQRLRAAPYHAQRVRAWDRASTAGGGCYTAGVLMAYDGENYWVEDCVHGQWEPDERNQRILAAALKDRTRYGPKHIPTIWVESEGGSSGKDSDKALARILAGFTVKFEKVTGSKDVRAEPWASQLAALNVRLVEDGTWDINAFIREHELFRPDVTVKRFGKMKDQVDAACLLKGTLITTSVGQVPIEEIKEGDEVLTRDGYERVTWSGKTGDVPQTVRVLFANGSIVESTPEHLIWTQGRGWVRIDSLLHKDRVILCLDGEHKTETSLVQIGVIARKGTTVEVYDLTVDGKHEFFANGVLVHNSSAFNYLANKRQVGSVRFLRYGKSLAKKALHIVVGGRDDLQEESVVDHTVLVVNVTSPDPHAKQEEKLDIGTIFRLRATGGDIPPPKDIEAVGGEPLLSMVGTSTILDRLDLHFVDIDVADYQESWDKPVPPWNKPAIELALTIHQAKRLWTFLLKKRETPHDLLVIMDDGNGDRRAVSLALAVCDRINLNRQATIFNPADPEASYVDMQANQYLVEMVKTARSQVVF